MKKCHTKYDERRCRFCKHPLKEHNGCGGECMHGFRFGSKRWKFKPVTCKCKGCLPDVPLFTKKAWGFEFHVRGGVATLKGQQALWYQDLPYGLTSQLGSICGNTVTIEIDELQDLVGRLLRRGHAIAEAEAAEIMTTAQMTLTQRSQAKRNEF